MKKFYARLQGHSTIFSQIQRDLARLSVLLAHTHPETAHLIAEKITRGRRGINDYIKKRQEEGCFRQDIDAALFIQVLAMTFVMRAIGREGLHDLLPFAHLSREETINQLVSLLLYGIKKSDAPMKKRRRHKRLFSASQLMY